MRWLVAAPVKACVYATSEVCLVKLAGWKRDGSVYFLYWLWLVYPNPMSVFPRMTQVEEKMMMMATTVREM